MIDEEQKSFIDLCKDFSIALKADGVVIGEKVIANLWDEVVNKYPADK